MGFKRAFFAWGLTTAGTFLNLRLFLVAIVSISVTGFLVLKTFDGLKGLFCREIAATCVFDAAASFLDWLSSAVFYLV
jgi:hypothetical protein